MEKLRKWKKGMEAKGLRVNVGKTKVMQCQVSRCHSEDSGKHLVSVRSCEQLNLVCRVSQMGS